MNNAALLVLGALISVIGIGNIRGNIGTVHSYNRKRVREEDIPKYGKAVGTGTLIIGLGMIAAFALEFWVLAPVDTVLLPAFLVGLGFILYGQFKYNKGLF